MANTVGIRGNPFRRATRAVRILAIAVAYLIWNYGLEHIGAPRTAAFSNLVPVMALITATVWLSEQPSPLQIFGAAIIIGGVWLARVSGVKESTGKV